MEHEAGTPKPQGCKPLLRIGNFPEGLNLIPLSQGSDVGSFVLIFGFLLPRWHQRPGHYWHLHHPCCQGQEGRGIYTTAEGQEIPASRIQGSSEVLNQKIPIGTGMLLKGAAIREPYEKPGWVPVGHWPPRATLDHLQKRAPRQNSDVLEKGPIPREPCPPHAPQSMGQRIQGQFLGKESHDILQSCSGDKEIAHLPVVPGYKTSYRPNQKGIAGRRNSEKSEVAGPAPEAFGFVIHRFTKPLRKTPRPLGGSNPFPSLHK